MGALFASVVRLHEQGIAKHLEITRNAVLSYLPYDMGMKGAEYPSKNALKIRASRARKKGESNGK